MYVFILFDFYQSYIELEFRRFDSPILSAFNLCLEIDLETETLKLLLNIRFRTFIDQKFNILAPMCIRSPFAIMPVNCFLN